VRVQSAGSAFEVELTEEGRRKKEERRGNTELRVLGSS
jgi:hypothetical protein